MLSKQLNYLKTVTNMLEAEGLLGNMVLKQWKLIVDLIESTQSLNLDKPILVNKTETEIGKITPANFRKRISMLNQEFEDEENDFGIKIDNSKSSVVIIIDEDKVNKADEHKTVEFIRSRHQHNEINDDKFVVPKATTTPNLAQRQVLFSYSWESDKEELAVQRKFAQMLENGLKSPPAKYKDTPKVSLFIDHKGFEYGEHQTEQQDRVCTETPIAVICYTQKYIYSEACMREVDFYLDKDGHNLDNRRAIVMPFDCSYGDMDARFKENLAITPPNSFTNGLDFFSSATIADKKKLINQLVENIYKWFQVNPNPPKHDRHHVEKKTLHQLGEGVGQDHQNVENLKANRHQLQHEGAVDIVQTMFQWATGTTGMETRLFYLLGDFGAGKSTSCQMLTNELMENYSNQPTTDRPVLPIYLDLKKLLNAFNLHSDIIAEPITALLETMLSTTGVSSTISGNDIVKFINEYPCLLVFDGFDEVGQKLNTQQQTGLLNKLLDIFPKRVYQEDLERLKFIKKEENQDKPITPSDIPINSRILISCRTHFFKDYNEQEAFQQIYSRLGTGVSAGDIKNYQTYYLLPFTKKQIKNYLVNCLGELDADKAITFINTVHDLSGLSERPLMLNVIRDLLPELQKEYEQNTEINASTLYKLLFDKVQYRDNEKHLIPIDEKRKLLSRFALYMWQQGTTTLNVEDLDNWFLDNRENYPKINIKLNSGKYDPEAILQDLHNASLLVRNNDHDYRFAHTSFLEFFVAVGIFDSVIDCKDTSQGFDSIFKRDSLSREIMQFLLDWRVSHRLQDKFDKNWQLLQQAYSSTSVRQIALDIWYLGYDNQQSFTTLAKPNWHGLKLYKLKLDKQSENNLLDLSNANLSKASIEECDFSYIDLSDSNLRDAIFKHNTFEGCYLNNTRNDGFLFINNRLWYCKTSESFLTNVLDNKLKNFVEKQPVNIDIKNNNLSYQNYYLSESKHRVYSSSNKLVAIKDNFNISVWDAINNTFKFSFPTYEEQESAQIVFDKKEQFLYIGSYFGVHKVPIDNPKQVTFIEYEFGNNPYILYPSADSQYILVNDFSDKLVLISENKKEVEYEYPFTKDEYSNYIYHVEYFNKEESYYLFLLEIPSHEDIDISKIKSITDLKILKLDIKDKRYVELSSDVIDLYILEYINNLIKPIGNYKEKNVHSQFMVNKLATFDASLYSYNKISISDNLSYYANSNTKKLTIYSSNTLKAIYESINKKIFSHYENISFHNNHLIHTSDESYSLIDVNTFKIDTHTHIFDEKSYYIYNSDKEVVFYVSKNFIANSENLNSNSYIFKYDEVISPEEQISLSQNAKYLLVKTKREAYVIYDSNNEVVKKDLKIDFCKSLIHSEKHNYLFIIDLFDSKVIDLDTMNVSNMTPNYTVHDYNNTACLLSPDYLCISSLSGTKIWSIPKKEFIKTLPQTEVSFDCYVTEDGKHFATSDAMGLSIWNAQTLECVNRIQIFEDAYIEFSDAEFQQISRIGGKAWKYLTNVVTDEKGKVHTLPPDTHPDWETAYQE